MQQAYSGNTAVGELLLKFCTLIEEDDVTPTVVSFTIHFNIILPSTPMYMPVAERSKARVRCRSLAGIAGSYPAGDMDISSLV